MATLAIGNGLSAQTISTLAGNGTGAYAGDGFAATAASLNYPTGVVTDAAGNVFVADLVNHCVRKIDGSGIITTVAGTGTMGSSGDGGPATAALLNAPECLAFDTSGNLYIADQGAHVVRKIDASGTISRVAGNGLAGYTGDGVQATATKLNNPGGLAFDRSNNLYIADAYNNRVRKVTPAGIISTVAGFGGANAYGGDGGPATAAQFHTCGGVAVDTAGNIFITDAFNHRLRVVRSDGNIYTFAGTGTAGYNGDGIAATSAQLNDPSGVMIDRKGNIIISDFVNHRVRMVSPAGVISTIAGTGVAGFSGDGGTPTAAKINFPYCVWFDVHDNGYIADYANHRIRKITPDVTLGLQGKPANPVVDIYPNPGSGVYTISVPGESGRVVIVITDVAGRVVATRQSACISGSARETFDLRSAAPGAYTVSVYGNGSQTSTKLVIQ